MTDYTKRLSCLEADAHAGSRQVILTWVKHGDDPDIVATEARANTGITSGGLLIIISQPLRLVVSATEVWLSFARWATAFLG